MRHSEDPGALRPSRHRARSGLALLALVTATAPLGPSVAEASAQELPADALAALSWREIGPATMGGRVADIAVDESDPSVIYVGLATGGVWKTTNHATSWEPIFDRESTASVGDVTLAPSNPNIVWVGTGEPQNRQSSPWGDGVYKSVDGGRSWTLMGLEETRHIARIQIHPRDPNIVYVAAVGHLWGPNEERGVFKTTDGGESWEKVLYLDENTGAIDLAMDPTAPNTLFAAMYTRRRSACCFAAGGRSGLFRTLDGGESWEEVTNGFAQGEKGRIGVDIYRTDPNVVYAVVEAHNDQEGIYRSTDRGASWERMSGTNPRPMYFSQIRIDPNDMDRIYLGGVQLHRSHDGGRSFPRELEVREVHSDHHALWIDPSDSDHVLMGSDGGVSVSWDGGESWRMYDNLPIGQFYEIGYDMADPYNVCGGLQDNGTWCGPSRTLTRLGIRNADWFNVAGGDGFYAQIDPTDNRTAYVESQNGNFRRVDIPTGEDASIRPAERARGGPYDPGDGEEPDYRWNWNTPLHLSEHDPSTLFAGANVLFRTTDRGLSWEQISPDLTYAIDRDTIPVLGELVERGETLSAHDGISYYSTLTTVHQSPIDPEVLYTGADDGALYGTRDGGATWVHLTPNVPELPPHTYVSRVYASHHAPGRVYASFDNHYHDDYDAYVYASDDYGASWRRIDSGLPEWSVNVVIEHADNEDLLFVGNEVGVYVSIDRGAAWHRLGDHPVVPVDDLEIHPRERDLIAGTHGRSIWIMDDIQPLVELRQAISGDLHLFQVGDATDWHVRSPQGWDPGVFELDNPRDGARIRYWVGEGGVPAGDDPEIELSIVDADGAHLRTLTGPGTAGTHEIFWDFREDPVVDLDGEEGFGGGGFGSARFLATSARKVLPGRYTARLETPSGTQTRSFEVRYDPRLRTSRAILAAREEVIDDALDLVEEIWPALRASIEVSDAVEEALELLEGREGVPASLLQEAEAIEEELDDASDAIEDAAGGAAGAFRSADDLISAPPSEDTRFELEEAWAGAPDAVRRLNGLLGRLPAFFDRVYADAVQPEIPPAAPIPQRGGI